MSNIVGAFNNHFEEFISDIIRIFPDDVDILSARTAFSTIRKTNPKMIVKLWSKYITIPYNSEIQQGNIDFFLNKDYSSDLGNSDEYDRIMNIINRLREPIRNMIPGDQEKAMKYIQNLTKLSLMISH